MESVLYLKNLDGMPDIVLYICYQTVFIFFVYFWVFTIRIHNAVGEGGVSRIGDARL
jgi:hypothetical protein